MRSVTQLRDGRFYDLLEAGAAEGRASVRWLLQTVETAKADAPALEASLRRSAQIGEEVRAQLFAAIVPSLRKTDIESLCRALGAIPAAVQRCGAPAAFAAAARLGADFREPLAWLEELTEILLDMTRQLRGFSSLDRINELHTRFRRLADRAEALVEAEVRRAYREPGAPLDVMQTKDAAERLQDLIERCREAGSLMNRISLAYL
jgi:hypothetical protein